jgi:hypothetical protein
MQDDFETRKLRYISLRHIDPTGSVTGFGSGYNTVAFVAEFQIFGEGYIPEVEMTSDPIELSSRKNLVSIEWDAEIPPGTRVEIQTRTGDTMMEIEHFYDTGGKEISEKKYYGLPSFMRGEIKITEVPGSDWSAWSRPYMASGDPVTSPSPRTYLMIKARLVSDTPDTIAILKSIRVNFTQPFAKELVGELALASEDGEYSLPQVQPAALHRFSFFIVPTFTSSDRGFDHVLLKGPEGVTMELQGLKLGTREIPLSDVEIMPTQEDSLWIHLPGVVRSRTQSPVEVQFSTQVFRTGSLFLAWTGHSSTPNVWQLVDPGNATDRVEGNTLTVSVEVTGDILHHVRVEPTVFTPNNDGVNDSAILRFAVLNMNAQRDVTVTIHDLHGRVVEEWENVGRSVAGGSYEVTWEGMDRKGDLVAPGVYLCRIYVNADAGECTAMRMIAVAY